MSTVTGCMPTPRYPRSSLPPFISVSTIGLASSAGIAKPMPTLPPVGDRICELMPITLPCISNIGPPELPRLIEASVWMKRSEEHTSELQSLMRISYAVFCLKKKNKQQHRLSINKYQH